MPRKTFVAGEILTAADVNTNLMDQAVMVFADSAARGSAIPSPSEGMVTYLSDVNALEVYTGASFVPAASGATLGAGSILQVVQASTTTETVVSSTVYTDTTLSGTITPRATTSNILVLISQSMAIENQTVVGLRAGGCRLLRDGSAVHTLEQFKTIRTAFNSGNPNTFNDNNSIVYLDSPSTTSAVTYTTQIKIDTTANSSFVTAQRGSNPSTIMLLEVAG